MNPPSTELWRKSETVSIDRFPPCLHDSIRRGLKIMKGELPDDTCNEYKQQENDPITFSEEELSTLREQLGPKLVHGDYTLHELKDMLRTSESGRNAKFRRN